MKKSWLFLIIFLCSINIKAQMLSPEASISLLTVSPGEPLYSTFGHSGIRIKDPSQNLDVVFNYGAFDFRTQGFYIKFLRGILPYQISGNYFSDELSSWSRENRLVTEQALNLSNKQKQQINAFLYNNYLPENREYAYKFFYDNCSTRLRDVVKNICGDSLQFNTQLHADSSYRQWIDKYARKNEKLWSDFGMDLAIGTPSDEKTGYNGAMFLPDNLMFAFDAAKINQNGQWQPFVLSKQIINQHMINVEERRASFFSPNLVLWALFFLGAIFTFFQFKNNSTNFIFDKILFTIVGLTGWLIILLWFFTSHGVTSNNLNIIWAFPFLFPIVLLLKKNIKKPFMASFFLVYALALILLLVAWNFLPQEINNALIPVVLLLIIRALYIWKNQKK